MKGEAGKNDFGYILALKDTLLIDCGMARVRIKNYCLTSFQVDQPMRSDDITVSMEIKARKIDTLPRTFSFADLMKEELSIAEMFKVMNKKIKS